MAAPALASTTNYGAKCQKFVITNSGANQGSVRLNLTRAILSLNIQSAGTWDSATMTVTAGNVSGSEATLSGGAVVNSANAIKTIVPNSAAAAGSEWEDQGWLYYLFTIAAAGSSCSLTHTITVKYA